ncbi:glyoxalase [Gordonia neofelifaecis]|uniref:Glyoxalase/bleomycin resistance protein/dioxygenase n=1 Tax=Gordonia neofelifaecis NRRL B-59395 TaxID=644548 RepID=F1YJQ6_9ACTN|nr:glyoxalase [Gordonia neofelifaecis]EGD54988.1 glyoxalase/bleomycin resistance protein/dioxygenase [Gordonia neofelifaecis NRRL B-59395]
MTNINTLTLQVADVDAAKSFYDKAFGLTDRLRFEQSDEATSGFRGFVISLVVADPAVVDSFFDPAIAAGARAVKPAKKSFWGYGGVLEAPDGTLWKIAASSKKVTGAPLRVVDSLVLLIGTDDIVESKGFYSDRGLPVAKSFGRKYVEFEAGTGAVTLALYGRKAAAKDAGVPPEGSGSHRLVVGSDGGEFVDPDGFAWV